MYLSQIPGYKTAGVRADRLEDYWRDFAFLGLTETIRVAGGGSLEVRQLTLRMFIQLCAVRSPFLVGGKVGPEHVAQILWRLNTAYGDRNARIGFVTAIAGMPFTSTVRAIQRYLDRMLVDKPPTGSRPSDVKLDTSFAASMIHALAKTYGWTDEAILDLPMPRIFQYLRKIRRDCDPDLPYFNPLRDRFTKRITDKYLNREKVMPTKVNIENASEKIRTLGRILKRPIRDVLDSGARLIAIEFAKTSQPFGTGTEAKQSGEKAVARDIYKVYALPGDAYADIFNEGVKAAFWRAYKSGEFEVAQRFLNDFGSSLRGVPLESFDGGAAHRSERNSTTGRVTSRRPKMVVTDPRALARYVELIKKDVGTGKGGWADVSRQISGSIRGLRSEGDITANWITRKGAGYGFFTRGGTEEKPTVTIRSAIPYARNILNGTAESRAKAIGRHRMLENLGIAVKESTRALPRAA